ncbi:hypothetical protein VKT23_009219 [Stygiomarasmius scandens]|uniref:Uncharacterized protein n=1 Tax=Marasmiellus scandens TaxID=2682957 RepID=A0ABR1JK03_9AGAR
MAFNLSRDNRRKKQDNVITKQNDMVIGLVSIGKMGEGYDYKKDANGNPFTQYAITSESGTRFLHPVSYEICTPDLNDKLDEAKIRCEEGK